MPSLEFGSWHCGTDRGGNGLPKLEPEPSREEALQPTCSEREASRAHSAECFAASPLGK